MKKETRNKKICEKYMTTEFTIKSLAKDYNLSPQGLRNILLKEIGKEEINKIKLIRKEKVAEKLKEDYLKSVCQEK